jgi:hypothetical protein
VNDTRIGIVAVVAGLAAGLAACRGIVPPGKTAGNTYGGAYSARFAPPEEEPKKEQKQEDAQDGKKAAQPEEKPKVAAVEPGPHDRPGFVTREKDGRVWAFRTGSKDLAAYLKDGEPGKSATLVGVGPGGMTVRAPDLETGEAYVFSRPGFEVWVKQDRIWAFRAGSKEAAAFAKGEEPGKGASLVGSGPDGRTVRAPDLETADAYLAALDR